MFQQRLKRVFMNKKQFYPAKPHLTYSLGFSNVSAVLEKGSHELKANFLYGQATSDMFSQIFPRCISLTRMYSLMLTNVWRKTTTLAPIITFWSSNSPSKLGENSSYFLLKSLHRAVNKTSCSSILGMHCLKVTNPLFRVKAS